MFENIIGYNTEKDELAKFIDIIQHPDYYKQFGVEIPKGIILHGEPGVGKTTFANSIIAASGRPCFTLRKNADTANFIKSMNKVFKEAKEKAPSIILLDDMDKFGDGSPYAQEYTSLQGIIDEYRNEDIFILGTANELWKMPQALTRAGRFDRIIDIALPRGEDSANITKYYMSNKNIDPSVDMNNIANLVKGNSCATLETIVNIAAMYAAYERQPTIRTEHLIEAILTTVYDMPKANDFRTPQERYMAAIHEAGHVVIEEELCPGSISYVTIRQKKEGRNKYQRAYDDFADEESQNNSLNLKYTNVQQYIIDAAILLGGKAAIEIKFHSPDPTAAQEMRNAMSLIDKVVTVIGADGFKNIKSTADISSELDGYGYTSFKTSDHLDKLYEYDKSVLARHWIFVEAVAEALLAKETLLSADIRAIKNQLSTNPYFAGLIK